MYVFEMTSPIDQAVNDAASTLVLLHQRANHCRLYLDSKMMTETSGADGLNSALEAAKRTRIYCNHKLVNDRDAKRRRRGSVRRSVRFATHSERGCHVTHVHERVTLEEAKHVWWTPEEISHIHRRERSVVQILASLCIPYVQQLDRLVDLAATDAFVDDNEEAPVWIANSSGRGLEPEVMHILDAKAHSAKRIVGQVLAAQKKLRECGDSMATPELKVEVLRAQYVMLSQRKVRMAQLLASGDALVARL